MKLFRLLVILAALWLVALLVLDKVVGPRTAAGVADRVADGLGAKGTVGDSDLALVRGRLRLDKLAVVRDDTVGHLSLTVDEVRCELPPLGLALANSDCRELAVRGVRLDVSAAALFHLHPPARSPLHANSVIIDDAELAFAPSAFTPGLGRIAVHIDHAETSETTFRTPLSWIFSLRVLRAHLDLPAGITVQLAHENGVLTASGTLFGSSSVELPVELPVAAAFADARAEVQALVDLGQELAKKLVSRRAEDWLLHKIF
jgi:hypothetical protein